MSVYAPTTLIGQALVDQLPWLPGDPYWLPAYLDAIGALFQQTAFIATDIGIDGNPDYQTGYGSIFTVNPRFDGDTAICPTEQLPYLGQFVGVQVPTDADDATARSLIASEQGFQRGSASAIDAAATRFLSGTQSLIHLTRETPTGMVSPFMFTLIVNPSQVIDEAGLIAAVNAVKPGWVQWALVITSGDTWAARTGSWNGFAPWTGTWNSA
jgi:hypothetical protein